MASQEINFYHLLPKKSGMYLNREVVILSYGLVILVLFLLCILFVLKKHNLSGEYLASQAQSDFLQHQIDVLVAKYPIYDQEKLKVSLEEVKAQIANKSSVIEALMPNANFSNYLLGIAESTVKGVWLKQITVNRDMPKIVLKGYMIQRAALEQFLNNLQHQPIFKGMQFNLEDLTESMQPATFTISTKQSDLYE